MPALQRSYVQEIEAEPDPARKIERYAKAVATIQPRMAPLLRVLRNAGTVDRELKKLWQEIADRRAASMRQFAASLKAAGGLRAGLSIEEAADVVWSMNSAEFYDLLVTERGWTPEQFEAWLADARLTHTGK